LNKKQERWLDFLRNLHGLRKRVGYVKRKVSWGEGRYNPKKNYSQRGATKSGYGRKIANSRILGGAQKGTAIWQSHKTKGEEKESQRRGGRNSAHQKVGLRGTEETKKAKN